MEHKKIIGERINSALAIRAVKQKELADALNVKDNVISYFCSGVRTPNTLQIIEIAKFLNVSSDYLLGMSDIIEGDITLTKASEHTQIPEKTLHNISRLYKLDEMLPGGDFAGCYKYHTFFFYEKKQIDTLINSYINSLYESFENAYNEMNKEAPDNGNNNPEDK